MQDTAALVSVIIPTYNRADVICRAIDSVLEQTYEQTEIVVVDDGSTDGTSKALRAYEGRIRVVAQTNTGPSIARNRGIAVARGQFIAFLDSDDYWLPSKLARQMDLLEKAGSATPCCLCNCAVLRGDQRKTSTFEIANTMPMFSEGLWTNPAQVLSTRFVMFNQAVVIRREILERVGYFDETLRFCEDYELPLRLSLEGPWAIIRDELVMYQDGSQGSWARRALAEEVRLHEDLLKMRTRISGLVEKAPSYSRLKKTTRRELRRARRQLTAIRYSNAKSGSLALLGRCLRFVERMRRAAFRRSPLFPRMEVHPLD